MCVTLCVNFQVRLGKTLVCFFFFFALGPKKSKVEEKANNLFKPSAYKVGVSMRLFKLQFLKRQKSESPPQQKIAVLLVNCDFVPCQKSFDENGEKNWLVF